MKTRTVRFSDALYAQLEAAAAADNRSVNGEIEALLKVALRARILPLTPDGPDQGS